MKEKSKSVKNNKLSVMQISNEREILEHVESNILPKNLQLNGNFLNDNDTLCFMAQNGYNTKWNPKHFQFFPIILNDFRSHQLILKKVWLVLLRSK